MAVILHCPFCGQTHPAEACFCPATGMELPICSFCGETVEPGWRVCGYCGQILHPVLTLERRPNLIILVMGLIVSVLLIVALFQFFGDPKGSENNIPFSASSETQIPTHGVGVAARSEEECRSFENSNDFHAAADCYNERTTAFPDDYSTWSNLARVYQLIDEWSLALNAGNQALRLAQSPEENADSYLRNGYTYYQVRDYPAAIESLKIGSEINTPQDAYTADNLLWLAMAYDANGQKSLACDSYRKTLEVANKHNYTWAINNAQSGLIGCP